MLQPDQEITLARGVYRLVGPLNHGNQGQAWYAKRLDDDTEYALKTLRLDNNAPHVREYLAQRLRNEIEFLRGLPEPEAHFIIPCLDAGEWHDGDQTYPAFVMPCLPKRLDKYDKAPDGTTLLRWAKQIAEALHWIHAQTDNERTLIHRDIKPKNILLTNDTNDADLRLIDFGIAKAGEGTETLGHRDASYFAPEQRLAVIPAGCSEDDVVLLSPKSDLYCLGLILFSMTIGDSAAPKAQARLREDQTRFDHIQKLQSNGRGLIGEIGGLQADERGELYDAALRLLRGEAGGTLIIHGGTPLPNLSLIANAFTEQVELLLSPDPKARPDAIEARTTFERLQDALDPDVTRIVLSAVPSEVTVGEQLTLEVEVEGRGLPADGCWLQLSVDNEPSSIVPKSKSPEKHFVSGSHHWHWNFPDPTLNQKGSHRAKVTCQAAGKNHEASIEYLVKATPDQLWSAGDRFAALELDPRPEWLKRLYKKARTHGQRAELVKKFKDLLSLHPGNAALEQYIRNIENNPIVPLGYVRPHVYALATVAMVATAATLAVGGHWLRAPATLAEAVTRGNRAAIQAALPELKRQASAGESGAHLWLGYLHATGFGLAQDQPAARRHYQKALELGANEAQADIDELDRLADLLLRSRDPAERARGYALAKAAAEAGDVNALVWLGYRYDRGDGVSPDAVQAARWYAAAEQAGDRVAAARLAELRR